MSMTVSHRARAQIILVTVVVAFVLLLITATRAFASGDAPAAVPAASAVTVEHVVEPGDTLWAIAVDHADPGEDIRRVVFEIQQANGLDSSVIIAGQVLVIPAG